MGIIVIQTLIHFINTCTPLSKIFSLYHKHTIILELVSNNKIGYPFLIYCYLFYPKEIGLLGTYGKVKFHSLAAFKEAYCPSSW